LFGLKERKWKERKLRKPMDELGLRVSPNSFIDFRDFLSFNFLSTQPNTPLEKYSFRNNYKCHILYFQKYEYEMKNTK
jgi:hypothetical protein